MILDSVINERFQLHDKLGEGGMAVVYQATDLDSGKEVALKLMKSPSVVFLIGEAGMGKSLFLREVARLARRHGADVFEGRCFEGNLAPYQPFVEIVRQLLTQLGNINSLQETRFVEREG